MGININQPTNPFEEHKDGLMQIESRYIEDIVHFFTKEYYNMLFYKNSLNGRSSQLNTQITNRLEQQVIKRLYETNLITAYNIEVIDIPIDIMRDRKISHILGDDNNPIMLCLKFTYKQSKFVELKSVMIAL